MRNEFCKRLLSFSAGLLMLSAPAALPVFAEAGEDAETFTEGKLTFQYVDGGVSVIKAEQDAKNLVIPAEAGGQPVVSIGEAALENCADLTDLKIEDGVQKIEPGAFFYCAALENIDIPDSVTEIGGYAFAYCYSLTDIELPQHLKMISEYMFYYDLSLEEITLPPETEQIGYMSFAGCYALRKMSLPASMIYISESAVVSCIGLSEIKIDAANTVYHTDEAGAVLTRDGTVLVLYPAGSEAESYEVPRGVETIAGYAFSGAVKLKEIKLPTTIQTIGAGAFSECRSLTSLEYPPLTAIASSAFADCEALESFTIPETVTTIGQNAFYGCSALREITIPESVEQIMAWAFCGCTGIQRITVPDSVTTIENSAFGFVPNENAESSEDSMLLQEGFVLAGSAESQAKVYAEANGIAFEQIGLSKNAKTAIAAGVIGVLLIAAAAALIVRRKKDKPAAETAAPAEEAFTDPNYTSILADDEDDGEDPYDRSYGILPDDDDDETETAEAPEQNAPADEG